MSIMLNDDVQTFPSFGEQTAQTYLTRLKWFNSGKGFGFVVPAERPEDAFLHVTTLQEVGLRHLDEGAELVCEIDFGPKGAIVRRIVDVISVGVSPLAALTNPSVENQTAANDSVYAVTGSVKWYNLEKGFGFVQADDGQKDIFVHKSCLDRLGLHELTPGQRLRLMTRKVPKGREAISFEMETSGTE